MTAPVPLPPANAFFGAWHVAPCAALLEVSDKAQHLSRSEAWLGSVGAVSGSTREPNSASG